MRRPRLNRLGRAALVAAGLIVLLTVPVAMAALGRDTPPAPPGQAVPVPAGTSTTAPGAESQGRRAGATQPGYWTEERMRQAPGAAMHEDR
jgi:hypothetical protein